MAQQCHPVANGSNPEAHPANNGLMLHHPTTATPSPWDFCIHTALKTKGCCFQAFLGTGLRKKSLNLVSPMLKRQGKKPKNPAICVRGNKAPMHPCIWISHSWVHSNIPAHLSSVCIVSWFLLTAGKRRKTKKETKLCTSILMQAFTTEQHPLNWMFYHDWLSILFLAWRNSCTVPTDHPAHPAKTTWKECLQKWLNLQVIQQVAAGFLATLPSMLAASPTANLHQDFRYKTGWF